MENWLPLSGYGDAYSVSSLGRVMRIKPRNIPWRNTGPERSRAKPFAPNFIKAFIHRTGYPQVRIGPTGQQMTVMVHRLIALTFVSNPRGHSFVNHIDGNKRNNCADNLEWVTRVENARHSIAIGLQTIHLGQLSPNAKLTEEAIVAIRRDTRLQRLIAADYNVDQTTISQIKLRKIWSHVPDHP